MQFKTIKTKKGLNLPVTGAPEQKIYTGQPINSVGILGREYIGLKPSMLVREGDRVALGQPIFSDKAQPGVQYTSPGCGVVGAIHRGEKRALRSVEITLDGNDEETFDTYSHDALSVIGESDIRKNLIASGLWTAFRTRPYSKVP
ncbi:MAG: NADH:ubiquinone reductase (Na(+)-transporting) subunit A, partial [Gammaproteobacteria bacterium]|nr:NADH:ubiquinone reductase (Na(+)-transporting) subunit A [Gammaproteobacteria bacterium]